MMKTASLNIEGLPKTINADLSSVMAEIRRTPASTYLGISEIALIRTTKEYESTRNLYAYSELKTAAEKAGRNEAINKVSKYVHDALTSVITTSNLIHRVPADLTLISWFIALKDTNFPEKEELRKYLTILADERYGLKETAKLMAD